VTVVAVRMGMKSHDSHGASTTSWGTLVFAAVLSLAACGDTPLGTLAPLESVDLAQPWQEIDPRSHGWDADALRDAAGQAGEQERSRSLLVVHGGRIVLERYYGEANSETLHDVRSVTKTVVSTLVGLAIEDGFIRDVDQPLGELLPDSLAELRPEQQAVTVQHLLTMSSGFAWTEAGSVGYNAWRTSDDYLGHFLDPDMTSEPGASFNYNSGAIYLLGLLVEEATGMELEAFADQELFGPLGITTRQWESMGNGRVNGGAGIDLRTRDLARLGQLFLQEGMSGDRRVLPSGWEQEATANRFPWTASFGPVTALSYAYLWWLDLSREAYFAWGYGGQYVYVVPSLDLVVVTTTDWRLLSAEGGPAWLEEAMLNVIASIVEAAPTG
jgi:CubicO group peptidase (beta-lactamase class C family)